MGLLLYMFESNNEFILYLKNGFDCDLVSAQANSWSFKLFKSIDMLNSPFNNTLTSLKDFSILF